MRSRATSAGKRRARSRSTRSPISRRDAGEFSRTLSTTKQSGSQLAGSVSVGDYWRPDRTLQVQYGIRVDANRFLSTPATNPALDAAFGLRTDRLPNRVYLSPRIGLQWSYGKSHAGRVRAGFCASAARSHPRGYWGLSERRAIVVHRVSDECDRIADVDAVDLLRRRRGTVPALGIVSDRCGARFRRRAPTAPRARSTRPRPRM